jgi:phage-related protein
MIFTFTPTQGTQATYKPKMHVAQFGNGYAQRTPAGINNNPKAWDLSFDNLDDHVKEQIRSFLSTVSSTGQTFTWTDLDFETLLYICVEFTIGYTEDDDSSIKCKFEQVFG